MDDPTYLEEMTRVAYTAYSEALGGRDLDGRPLPEYSALHVSQHGAWRAALLAALAVPQPSTPPAAPPHADAEESSPRTRR